MVRHKVRWLLVRLDFQPALASAISAPPRRGKKQTKQPTFPTKKEFSLLLRQHISSCFGISADGAAQESQVRLVDETTRLILIRVPREFCGIVRSTLSLVTRLEPPGATTTGPPQVVISTLSVNGSSRTAKLATMATVRRLYRQRVKGVDRSQLKQELDQLKELMMAIQGIY